MTTWQDCEPLESDWKKLQPDHAIDLFRLHPTSQVPTCQLYSSSGQPIGLYNGQSASFTDQPSEGSYVLADWLGVAFLRGELEQFTPVPLCGTAWDDVWWLPTTHITHVAIVREVKELLQASVWAHQHATMTKFHGGIPVIGYTKMSERVLKDINFRGRTLVCCKDIADHVKDLVGYAKITTTKEWI
jgi:hypothetical protein